MKNGKFKVKPLFVLAVTALVLLVTAISTVTYAWIETGNNLVIQTADASNNAANVSVVNRAGYARNMAKNKQDSVINLNEYVDYRNLYFAPAKGEMLKADGSAAQTASEAADVKVSINGENPRDVLPEDISTNYIDFEIKVKNNENTHSDIKFANSDTDRVLVIDGVDVSKAKFGVAVIATNTNGDKKVIFTDSEKLLKETPSFGTLYPHEELTLRVKIWLDSDYSKFIDKDTVIAGMPVTLNLSLVMTDPKTTTFKFADKTTVSEARELLGLGQAGGYKVFAVNGGNTDEKYELTADSTDADGVTTMSGMPEFLLNGDCKDKHSYSGHNPERDEFQLWAYEDGDLTKDPKVWVPGFKPPVSENQTALDAFTDTYTIYGDLDLRKSETYLRGTWQKVVEVELRDQSIEKIFTDESIRIVTLYNGIISYPMYRNRVRNSVGEMEPTNALTSYMPGYIFTRKDIGKIHFNSRVTDNCEGTDNLWGTVRANNDYTAGRVENEDKYVFSVFGFTGSRDDSGKEDYCFGEWYSGEVDKITLRDVTTGRRIQTDYHNHYINNEPKQLRVSYKGNCNDSGDGLGESFYLANFDKDAKCWYTTLPRDINPHAGNSDDNLVQFRLNANDGNDKLFKACDRVQTNGEYVYYFINEFKEQPLGSWNYNLADDTVIYMPYHESDITKGHTGLFVMQNNPDIYTKPLDDYGWNNNRNYGIFEDSNNLVKVYYINKYDFDLGEDKILYGETFQMRPNLIASNGDKVSFFDKNITNTTDGKPLYVGGRYRIDADGKVTELASFGYIRSEQIVIADVNEICSLQGAVDFQDPGTNITYSLQLNVTEGTDATPANVTKLSISTDAADYGRLTFQANKAGEYKVKVTAKANEGTTEKTSEKTFIFKVGLNPRITIADNVNVKAVTFNYTDENGNKRKLVKGSSAKIMQGTVLTGSAATMNNYSYLRFNNGYTATLADGSTTDITEGDSYKYIVTNQAAVIDVKVKDSENPYIICGENKWEGITQDNWSESIEMSYDRDRNTVFADITKNADGDAKIKIVRNGNGWDGSGKLNRDNDYYCVNYGNPPVKVSVPGVTAKITGENYDLTITGVASGASIRVEYDITNHVIYIKQTLASIDVKLFAVPEFDTAQVSVTAKGQDAAIIKAGKNDGTGTAYEGTTVKMEQIVNNADFNSYSVKYFTVEFKNAIGKQVGEIVTVHPGDKFTMPEKTEDEKTNVALVEITTHINKDDTHFYVAGSADNINWQLPTKAMTVTDNTVTGYVTVDNIGENGECFIRIAKGSYEETAFKQVNTSVTMSKAGRPNVYVESDSNFPATHEQQSIKIIKPGIFKQTFKVTYDLGNHRMTISAPLYFQSTLETMSVTTNVTTNIVIGALLPNSSNAKYTTVCTDVDASIGDDKTATPTFKSSNNEKDYKVVTTAEVTINGEQCFASKTFNVDVNDLVDVTIKKHDKFAISGVKVKATHGEATYTPSASDVTFRAAKGDTVTLKLDIPNDKFNGFYADESHNFTITDGNGATVTPTFTKSATGDYTVATFPVPPKGATVTPNPAQHTGVGDDDKFVYYLVGDANNAQGLSWPTSKSEAYKVKFDYNKDTNTITYNNLILKGNPANIKISREGYISGKTNVGYDNPKYSVSYTDTDTDKLDIDYKYAPSSVNNAFVTGDAYKDIQIQGIFNASNPKSVNLTYYLAEHRLVISDSANTDPIITDDLLAVLRKQKIMFYFGIDGNSTAGYLNVNSTDRGKNYTTLQSSILSGGNTYKYSPICIKPEQYYIAQDTTWAGKQMSAAAEAGKMYLLHLVDKNDIISVLPTDNNTIGCTVPKNKREFSVNLTQQQSIETDVTLNSSTSVTGAPNSLTYYITKTPTNDEPTIGDDTEFKPFDPSNLKQLSEGNYIVVPVVSDGSVLVRGDDIKLSISNKTTVDVDVTVEGNDHAKVTAKSGAITIDEGQTETLHADDEVTINAPIENATFNSYTRVQSFDIINAETGDVIKTVPATNNSATFTVPNVKKADGAKGEVIIKAKLIQSDTVKYLITGENIYGIDYWAKDDTNANQLMTFDPDKNTVTKEIKATGTSVQFKISKNSLGDNFIDNPQYAISEATPQPKLEIDKNLTDVKFSYVTIDYNGEKHNFQLESKTTDGSLQDKTYLITYDLSAHTVTVSAPSTTKPKHTVKITPVEHAVVTATYTNASGETVIIEESNTGTPVDEGTELTLNCAILNPDFNSFNFAKYDVTGADLSGSKLIVGTSDITVTTNLSRDTTSNAAKFYLTGTALKADGKTLDWDNATAKYAVMPYDTAGANTVSIPIVLNAGNIDTPKIKISKGDYVGGTDKKGRDNEDYSVTIAKVGRNDVTIENKATDVVSAELATSGEAKDRCLVFSYANGVTGNLNLKLTYDLDTNTIIIDKVAAPTNVTVTLKPHNKYDTSGITIKAEYTGATLEVINNENNFITTSGDVLTLSATIPNASFNSYTLNKFVVSDGTNTTDVTKVDGKYTYTIPDTGVTELTITADITQADPELKLAHRAGTSGDWTVENLTFDSDTNKATGTFNVTTESDKYFTISNTDASKVITLSSTNVTDNSTYADYESTGKSVKVKLPAGLTQQPLKFTYDLKTNVVTVDAPVKFNDLSDNAITTKKNTAVTLKSTATATSGTPTYVTACTSTNSSTASFDSTTSATPKFTATADGTYTVTTTATVGSYVAVKTYTITVNPASTLKVYVTGTAANKDWGQWKELQSMTQDGTVIYTTINGNQDFKVSTKEAYDQYEGLTLKNTTTYPNALEITGGFNTGESGGNLKANYSDTVYLCCNINTGELYALSKEPTGGTTEPTTSNVTITNNTGYSDDKITAVSGSTNLTVGEAVALEKGAEVTVTVNVPNAKFNSKYATFSGVTATSTGTNTMTFTVPDNEVTVIAGIAQNTTDPSFKICGSGYENAHWEENANAVEMTFDPNTNKVTSVPIKITNDDAQFKIVKGGNVNANRNDAAYSVSVESNGATTLTSSVGTLGFTGSGDSRNIQLTNANGKTVTVTYDLENNTVSIAEAVTVQKVNVTVNAHSEFAKSGIKVKVEDHANSVTSVTGQGDMTVNAGITLKLTATIPNADFNNYTFTRFKIEEKNDSDTVLATKYVTTNGGTYTLSNASATKVVITAEFSTETKTQKTLNFASSSDKSNWTAGVSLTSPQSSTDANFNTFTGTFNVPTDGNKYISICSGSDTTKRIEIKNDNGLFTTDDTNYAVFDSGCVLAKLPSGATKQTLKFTYTPADGKLKVELPVKFAETTASVTDVAVNTAKTDIDVSVTNSTNGTIAYTSTVVTKPNGASDPTIKFTDNKMSFTATKDGEYKVVVTATATVGDVNYVATKTYSITVSAAETNYFQEGDVVYFKSAWSDWTKYNVYISLNNNTANARELSYTEDGTDRVYKYTFTAADVALNVDKFVFQRGNGSEYWNKTREFNYSDYKNGYNCIYLVKDGDNNWNDSGEKQTYTPSSSGGGESKNYVYFKNTAGWSTVKAHMWDSTSGNNTAWPGTEMEQIGTSNIYRIDVGDRKSIIFHNGAGTQTGNLTVEVGKMYNYGAIKWEDYTP